MSKKAAHFPKLAFIERLLLIWGGFLLFIMGGHYFLPVPFTYIFILSSLIVLLCYFFKNGSIISIGQEKKVFWGLLLFSIYLFFEIPFSQAPGYGLTKSIFFLIYSFVFLLSARYIVKGYHYFGRINLLFAFIFLGFLFFYFKDPISFLESMTTNRIRLGQSQTVDEGNAVNPIWLARYLGFSFLIVLTFFKVKNLSYRIIKIVLLITIAIYLFCCGSRGPVLAILIPVFLFNLNLKRFKAYQTIIMILAIAVGLFFLLDLQSNKFLISRFTFSNNGATSVDTRYDIYWEILRNISFNNFFFGHGTGAAGYLLTGGDNRMYPHSSILEILYENGLVGLFFLLGVIYHSCKMIKYRNLSTQSKFWLTITFYFIINSMFSGDLMSNQFILFGYFNLLSYLYIMKRNKISLNL